MVQVGNFDELKMFSDIKGWPALYLGEKSLLSLRDLVGGVEYVFRCINPGDPGLKYLYGFIQWYTDTYIQDQNGYAAWWNHILYKSRNLDSYAFDCFYRYFEEYLDEVHGIALPEPEKKWNGTKEGK